jgi:hypothetical protein
MTAALAVLAVVVATRGGTRLAAALASVAWAAERAVLDPLGDVAASELPPGVRLGHDVAAVAALGDAPWMLVLGEEEVATPALEAAVAAAVTAAVTGVPSAWCPVLELQTLGVCFARRRATARLAPRGDSQLTLDRTLELALVAPLPLRRLPAAVRAERGASISDAVDALLPESRARAALLAQLRRRPGAAELAAAPLLALARVLGAHASEPAGLGRWIAGVFAAYRVVLTHARLWEWRHAQPAPMEEIA